MRQRGDEKTEVVSKISYGGESILSVIFRDSYLKDGDL